MEGIINNFKTKVMLGRLTWSDNCLLLRKKIKMKISVFLAGFSVIMITVSCNQKARYLDLNSNKYIDVKKDSTTGQMVNAKTGVPVDVYVDTKMHDTIYGATGETINGRVYKNAEGQWAVKSEGDEYKAKSEGANAAKVKVEGDKYKYKNGDYTIKKESDGDIKIENGSTETKIDGRTGKRTVKKDHNITTTVKKIFH